jgi:hypothetical protein
MKFLSRFAIWLPALFSVKVPRSVKQWFSKNWEYIVFGAAILFILPRLESKPKLEEMAALPEKERDTLAAAELIAKCLATHPNSSFIDSRKLWPDTDAVTDILVKLKDHLSGIEAMYYHVTGNKLMDDINEKFSITEKHNLYRKLGLN